MASRSLNVLKTSERKSAHTWCILHGPAYHLSRLSLLERPVSSSASLGRRWFGYGPYKPVMVGKLLDIFRVFYNFVEVGRDKQTPAMRLGLAKGKITVENIIYYQ
jgi:hypothetical protein